MNSPLAIDSPSRERISCGGAMNRLPWVMATRYQTPRTTSAKPTRRATTRRVDIPRLLTCHPVDFRRVQGLVAQQRPHLRTHLGEARVGPDLDRVAGPVEGNPDVGDDPA